MSALSAHMALHKHWPDLPPSEKPSPDQIELKLSLEILFQENPVSAKMKLMIHRLEMYGKCKHIPEFHTFAISTD
eukprot:15191268-Ditylum_brightwellii.AAC.1